MCERNSIILLMAAGLAATAALAEIPPLSPERLRADATHIVKGKVLTIYQRTESKGDYEYFRYLAEIRVEACEKGDGIKKGQLLYTRYWERRWVGKGYPLPGIYGQHRLPEEGERVRVFLKGEDGGFDFLEPNGSEKVKG